MAVSPFPCRWLLKPAQIRRHVKLNGVAPPAATGMKAWWSGAGRDWLARNACAGAAAEGG